MVDVRPVNALFSVIVILAILGSVSIFILGITPAVSVRTPWKYYWSDVGWSLDNEIDSALGEFNCSRTRFWLTTATPTEFGHRFLQFLLRRRFARMRAGIDPFRVIILPPVGGLGNRLRSLLSATALSLFTKSVVLVNGGLTDRHTSGHFLDSYAFRDDDLQLWSRLDDPCISYRFGSGQFYGIQEPDADSCRSLSPVDPLIFRFLSESSVIHVDEIDGENTHRCVSTTCRFLAADMSSALLESVFSPDDLSRHRLAVVLSTNNFYLPHIFRSEGKTRILCEVFALCEDFDYEHFLSQDVPFFGFQYAGSKLGGALFRSLFRLHPLIRTKVDEKMDSLFLRSEGTVVVGLQVRATWMNLGRNDLFWTPEWEEFSDCVSDVLDDLAVTAGDTCVVYVASDSPIPENVRFEIGALRPGLKVVSRDDVFALPVLPDPKDSLQNRIDDDSVRLATLFDFEVLRRADVSVVTFFSSFGHISTMLSSGFPPYVVFGKGVLERFPKRSCVRPRLYSYWRNRFEELRPFGDWLFDFGELSES